MDEKLMDAVARLWVMEMNPNQETPMGILVRLVQEEEEKKMRQITLFTGRGGMWDFDTEMIVELSLDKKTMAEHFRKTRQELYTVQLEKEKLERLWFVRLYLTFNKWKKNILSM